LVKVQRIDSDFRNLLISNNIFMLSS